MKPSTTISAYLVEGHPRNISVKLIDKRAMMALGRLPEYHWNQIISKSVQEFSRRSRFKLFSIYSPGGRFVQRSETV